MTVPVGWFEDPAGSGQLRLWDGRLWTNHYVPKGPIQGSRDGWYAADHGLVRWFAGGQWTEHVATPLDEAQGAVAMRTENEQETTPARPVATIQQHDREERRSAARAEREASRAKVAERSANTSAARHHEKAAKKFAKRHDEWEAAFTTLSKRLNEATTFAGVPPTTLNGRPGEKEFAYVPALLIEMRPGAVTYTSGSSGLYVPLPFGFGTIAGRRPSRRRQAPAKMTMIDGAVLVITNQRAVFLGKKETRTLEFNHLLRFTFNDHGDWVFHLDNRTKPVTFNVVARNDAERAAKENNEHRLRLAVAHFSRSVDNYEASLKQALISLRQDEPQQPAR